MLLSEGNQDGAMAVPTRPFFNVVTGLQDAQLVATLGIGIGIGIGSGQIAINETSGLWGAGFALRKEICASCAGRVSALDTGSCVRPIA